MAKVDSISIIKVENGWTVEMYTGDVGDMKCKTWVFQKASEALQKISELLMNEP